MQAQTTTIEAVEQEKQLVRELADLTSKDEVIFIDSGWDSRVYSVNNGRYFFKFPRSDKIRKRYEQQIAALKLLTSVGLKVRVPKVIWEHPNNNYFGYEGVQGAVLEEIVSTLDEAAKQAIGKTIGEFLKQFHQLELPGVRDITVEQEIKQFQEWYEPAMPIIQKVFSEAEQTKLKKLVSRVWPSELIKLTRDAALCHGDLHFTNIMYGNDGQLGIIDFGDVGYYDRSKDFIDLDDHHIFESALETYGDNKELRQKIAIRQKVSYVITLTAAIGKQNEPGIQKTLAKLKAAL